MAEGNSGLSKPVSRGESLAQIIILLIVILGVSQFANALSPNSSADNKSTSSSVGQTGARGPAGADGQTGPAGPDGEPGARGTIGPRGVAGAQGATGATGPTGIPGTLTTAYGQLSTTSSIITFSNPNDWVAVPFAVAGASSKMSVSTTSPASITVQQEGVCQVSVNIYLSAEESDEGTYTPTTYTLGIRVNDGSITPVGAVEALNSGGYVLNYNNILDLSANDKVRFYMAASDTEFGAFANIVTVESGNAYLMQISN